MNQKVTNTNKFNSVYSLYKRDLTDKEVFDIDQNLLGFMETLLKMDRKLKEKKEKVYAESK